MIAGVLKNAKPLEFIPYFADNKTKSEWELFMKKLFTITLSFFLIFNAFSQVSFIPYWELLTDLRFKKDPPFFDLPSRAKIGFNLQVFPQAYFSTDFEVKLNTMEIPKGFHPNAETRAQSTMLSGHFDSAILAFPNMKNKNVYLTLFYGNYDELNSDKLLIELTKARMRSYFFYESFPTSIFKPELNISGVGFSIYGDLKYLPFYLAGYVYWNGKPSTDFSISTDFRFGYTFASGSINAFLGATFFKDIRKTSLRTGFTGVFILPSGYELFVDFGIKDLAFPITTSADFLKYLYALIEPRITSENLSVTVPFFLASPDGVKDVFTPSGNKTLLGFGIKIAGGNLEVKNYEAGVGFYISTDPTNPMGTYTRKEAIIASPFFSYAFSNYRLDTRVNIYPCAYQIKPLDVFSISIQLKAVH